MVTVRIKFATYLVLHSLCWGASWVSTFYLQPKSFTLNEEKEEWRFKFAEKHFDCKLKQVLSICPWQDAITHTEIFGLTYNFYDLIRTNKCHFGPQNGDFAT